MRGTFPDRSRWLKKRAAIRILREAMLAAGIHSEPAAILSVVADTVEDRMVRRDNLDATGNLRYYENPINGYLQGQIKGRL